MPITYYLLMNKIYCCIIHDTMFLVMDNTVKHSYIAQNPSHHKLILNSPQITKEAFEEKLIASKDLKHITEYTIMYEVFTDPVNTEFIKMQQK